MRDRFGQSLTILPDGRIVMIAGEHEDSYDPDFCIYNDVFVFEPDGQITIYGYPSSVFPPTDFHTATLVGDQIYILGSLGYAGTRTDKMPVYRLSTVDFHIEPVTASGVNPGRIYRHRASQAGGKSIVVQGGSRLEFDGKAEKVVENDRTFILDLDSMVWTSAS